MNNMLLALAARLQAARTQEEGQTMVEYGLILSLISVVAIVAAQLVGTNVRDVFNSVAGDLIP